MNINVSLNTGFAIPFLTVVTFLCFAPNSIAQNEQTDDAAHVLRGAATNGMFAKIEIQSRLNGADPELKVSVVDTNAQKIFGEKDKGINWAGTFANNMQNMSWRYFKATNSFCGVVELRDINGKQIRALHPELSSSNAYNSSYSLSEEYNIRMSQQPKVSLRPLIFPAPLISPESELARFRPGAYFEVQTPGTYALTIRLVIYNRASTNDDVCKRIDLPPISTIIKLNHSAKH